ncbi:hypothetical protein BD560DRAFT_455527 [Blakeslea trispora]|nr:hypothetical protein BD560DRAFT_455527 [Blakeslea trispora]
MLEDIYTNTPVEWLQQMTRWQFFTAESLDEMTQESLEQIFAQYAQTIEAFRPVKTIPSYHEDSHDEDDDDDDDDLWLEDEEENSRPPLNQLYQQQAGLGVGQSNDLLFSHPNYNLSAESVDPVARMTSPLSDKPLPANPTSSDDTAKKARRKSGFAGNKNRFSWTSDTGITPHIVSQNLANEIMSLFDMEFSVDIKVNTAPKLPELPFKPQRKSQNRKSLDMMSLLMPAFDQIALENSPQKLQYNYQPPMRPKMIVRSLPQRSSSLRDRQLPPKDKETVSLPSQPSPSPPPPIQPMPSDTPVEKTLSKKKSLLRLITGKKLPQPPLPKDIHDISSMHEVQYVDTTPGAVKASRKTSTSTVNSSTSSSSSWSNISETTEQPIPQKPLPEPPLSADFVPPSSTSEESNKKHVRRVRSKKRRSMMEKTKSKRKSNHLAVDALPPIPPPKTLSRSKSAFIKIGSGLKNKKQEKQIKRASSAKTWAENVKQKRGDDMAFGYLQPVGPDRVYSESPEEIVPTPSTSFVKRMASFNWRMKSRNKTVEF